MMSATERLLKLVDAEDRFDVPYVEVLPLQLEAANERLASRFDQVPLLANRAETSGIDKITQVADLVPLLFAHTAYKSYSQGWLSDGRWDRMSKWLATVTTGSVDGIRIGDVGNLDEWLKRLESIGHYVTCSSGTTGKPSLLSCAEADLAFSGQASAAALSWATGVRPAADHKFFSLVPPTSVVRNERIRLAIVDAFASRSTAHFFPLDPITISSVSTMVNLRRRITDGGARPGEIAAYEEMVKKRESAMVGAFDGCVDALIASREQKLLLSAMFAPLFEMAQGVQAKGFAAWDFHPDNVLSVAGGLKGASLPADYREFVLNTFNVRPDHVYQVYSMQEINTPFPMCGSGRYHVAPWVVLLPLDPTAEQLIETDEGEISARAGFFDISLEGRWGGVISGDRISTNFAGCACGHQGPTIGADISRFADLPGGDKISCSGTIDAYVRGVT